ncbi:hypothetical protein DUI87_22990 [Hirundo rustica rustica]|uniref:Uncharacterized protein n=1 Tax=Hirundo rustica rustica TaxID=333673 RepID=A0A3M0JH32_HIRRU|nr:hypothetical protein DUI87_22990 [Hirundo rustica rustica]
MPFGANWLESSSVEKDLENLEENKLSRSQKCVLVTKKAKEALAVIRSVASKWRKLRLTPSSAISVVPPVIRGKPLSHSSGSQNPEECSLTDHSVRSSVGGRSHCSEKGTVTINDMGDGEGRTMIRFDTKPGEITLID